GEATSYEQSFRYLLPGCIVRASCGPSGRHGMTTKEFPFGSKGTGPMLAPSQIEREQVHTQPRIEVSGLTVVYPNGTTALDNVSFTLGPGTICGLAGPNG